MASNFWNWAPSPLELKLKDARANANGAHMEGYIPYEADPKHYEDTPAVHAQEMMAGYVPQYAGYSLPNGPAQFPSNEMQGGARIPQDATQDLGKGWIYTQQQEQEQALRDEYSKNEQRIMEIEQELANIEKQAVKNLDDFDMQLAQNRAGIGDIGNAQMHLGRIDQRRAVARGNIGNNAKDRAAAEDEIDRLYMMRAEASPAQLAYYDRAIARKEAEYETMYGKKYGGELQIPTGKQDAGAVATFQGYDDVLQQEMMKNGNNGRLSQAQIDMLNGILDKLPAGEERNARKKALDAVKSNEKQSADDASARKKENEAVDEIMGSDSGYGLDVNASRTQTASNNKVVTVKRLSGGKIQYSCGKTVKTR